MWIDSHCHLNHKNIKEKGTPSDLILAAKEVGVEKLLTICCRVSEEKDELLSIANDHDNVWCSIGTHPCDASHEGEKRITKEMLLDIASQNENVIAFGETGLDYYYDYATKEDQRASFIKHMEGCREADLPIIIHSRDAEEDTISMLKDGGAGQGLNGVMHCFSGSQWMADQALDFGFYISFSGIVTFKSAQALRDVAKTVPPDRILIETDAPYLAPVPRRGKVNEPAYVSYTGAYLAQLYGLSDEEFAKITRDNFYRLFTKAERS